MKTNYQKGSVGVWVIVIAVIVIAAVAYWGVNGKGAQTVENSGEATSTMVSSTSTTPQNTEPTPVIASISQSSGPIGTTIELKGTNLAGFEGDLDAIIENSKGETAFLPGIGSVPRADQTIRAKIESQLCKQGNTYSGLPCESYLAITPGTYKIYTAPWGKESNQVMFTVIK